MCSKVLNGHIILTDTSITTILAPEMTYTPKNQGLPHCGAALAVSCHPEHTFDIADRAAEISGRSGQLRGDI